MNGKYFFAVFMSFCAAFPQAAGAFEKDSIQTSAGNLEITFIGHGTLMMSFNEKIIHIDPWTKLADYTKLPKADMIFITHEHKDHLDPKAVEEIRKPETILVLTEVCAESIEGGIVMKNGDMKELGGIKIEAVPAYNNVHKRDNGEPFHPKGRGNGYVLHFADKRIYVAGDTENISEMTNMGNIEVAFLPMNLPYTMTPEMTADAARKVKPKILYPYHFGETDTSIIQGLLKDEKEMEVKIRSMK